MDDHDIAPECRDTFQKAMNQAARTYMLLKCVPHDKTSDVKKQTNDLHSAVEAVIDAHKGFDKAMRGFDRMTINPVAVNRQIMQARDPSLPEYLTKSNCEKVISDAKLWRDAANQALDDLDAIKIKKGRKGDPAFGRLLADLISAYAAGGKEPGVSRTEKKRYGPMIRFFQDCIDLLGAPKKYDNALGRAAEKILYPP
jgi:hypothetical protein